MTIKFPAGETRQGFLLSRNDSSMRVALEGGHDVTEFMEVDGEWMSENLEPVEITFEWQRAVPAVLPLNEDDFICSQPLANHLIELLFRDSSEDVAPKHMVAGREVM